MSVVTALNQKGGVGKTSTCYHLAGALALGGRRVLLVDNDPQASLTQGFLGPQATRALDPSETIAAVYHQEAMAEQVIRGTHVPGVDLLCGGRAAGSFNVPDPHLTDWPLQTSLRDFLADVSGGYLVPLQPEDFGAQGIADVQESIDRVVSGPNPALRLLGFLVTMSNPRLSVHKGFEQLLRTHYGDAVFTTTIPISTDFKEAIVQRQPVAQYKPRGAATKVMKALGEEIFARLAAADEPTAAGEAA